MKNRKKSQKDNVTLDSSKSKKRSQQYKINPKNQKIHNISIIKTNEQMNQKYQKQEAKKYLQKTLNILSNRFKVKNIDKLSSSNLNTILNLSTSVYKIVKENLKQNNTKNGLNQSLTIMKNMNSNNRASSKALKSSSCFNYHNTNTNESYNQKIKNQIDSSQFILSKLAHNSHEVNNKNSRQIIMSQKQNIKQRANSVLNNYSSILDASSICQQPTINNDPQMVIINTEKRRSNSTLDNYFRDKFGTNAQDEQAIQKKLRVLKALKKSQQIVNKSNKTNVSHVKSSMLLSNCDINDKSIVMEKLKSKRSQNIK